MAKLWKQPRCPQLMNGLRKCGIYTHGALFSHKEHDIMLFAGKWMGLENFMLNHVSQVRRTKVTCFPLFVEARPKS
jgi:hypothetical protein